MLRGAFAFLAATLALVLTGCGSTPKEARRSERVILLSIDGFRWDYLSLHHAPHLAALARRGVQADRLVPSFPSKTFPNHYTLVTGLRPGHHGIVGNTFWDPILGERFTMAKTAPVWWEGGEPVWITAERQGVRTACYFWPGSETELHGRRPSRWLAFDQKQTCAQRIDGLLGWLDDPALAEGRLFTVYFDLVDTIGHRHGPDAPETAEAVREADDAVGNLVEGLRQRGLLDTTDLIVVSDHGMARTGPESVVFLEDLIGDAPASIELAGPYAGLRPGPGVTAEDLARALRSRAPAGVEVWIREQTPERWAYRSHPRIPPVLLLARAPLSLESRIGWPLRRAAYQTGNHGWDPDSPDMGAFFAASGPSFRHGSRLGAVDNVHLYALLCHLVGVTPSSNDGSLSPWIPALRNPG